MTSQFDLTRFYDVIIRFSNWFFNSGIPDPTFWSSRKNRSIRKISLISKSMTSKPGEQTIAIHILPNISRSKGNQAMTFGQLIEHNVRSIFAEQSYTKRAGETIPRPLSKQSKLSISLDQ